MHSAPRVLLLDGDSPTTLAIAKELSADLEATIVGAGTTRHGRLLRSKYCDVAVTVPAADDPRYLEALQSVMRAHRPQFVLPVGYESTAVLASARDELPPFVSTCLPDLDAFRIAADKRAATRRAVDAGVGVPVDYSTFVAELESAGRPAGALDHLEFPLFLRTRLNAGSRATTARVGEPDRFWDAYDRIAAAAPTDEVLVQESIDASGPTYACGVFVRDDVELLVGHEQLRSVPRHGGSGTRLRVLRDPALETRAVAVLAEIGWRGASLVEFKKRADGDLVFTGIDPTFWSSYALASSHGYRFASTAVATALDLGAQPPFGSPKRDGEIAFPLRELRYYAHNREEERLLECLRAIAKPGVPWNIDRSDPSAWLAPPASLIDRLPSGAQSRATDRDPIAFTRR